MARIADVAGIPVSRPSPSGSRMKTSSEKVAVLRSAIVLSWRVLYSGVNVAQTSIPPADHVMMNSHTRAIFTPPH